MKMSPADRAEALTSVGQELASSHSSHTLLQMLAHKQVTSEELATMSGLPIDMIAKIMNCEQEDGPPLWQLIALAEALELDLN